MVVGAPGHARITLRPVINVRPGGFNIPSSPATRRTRTMTNTTPSPTTTMTTTTATTTRRTRPTTTPPSTTPTTAPAPIAIIPVILPPAAAPDSGSTDPSMPTYPPAQAHVNPDQDVFLLPAITNPPPTTTVLTTSTDQVLIYNSTFIPSNDTDVTSNPTISSVTDSVIIPDTASTDVPATDSYVASPVVFLPPSVTDAPLVPRPPPPTRQTTKRHTLPTTRSVIATTAIARPPTAPPHPTRQPIPAILPTGAVFLYPVPMTDAPKPTTTTTATTATPDTTTTTVSSALTSETTTTAPDTTVAISDTTSPVSTTPEYYVWVPETRYPEPTLPPLPPQPPPIVITKPVSYWNTGFFNNGPFQTTAPSEYPYQGPQGDFSGSFTTIFHPFTEFATMPPPYYVPMGQPAPYVAVTPAYPYYQQPSPGGGDTNNLWQSSDQQNFNQQRPDPGRLGPDGGLVANLPAGSVVVVGEPNNRELPSLDYEGSISGPSTFDGAGAGSSVGDNFFRSSWHLPSLSDVHDGQENSPVTFNVVSGATTTPDSPDFVYDPDAATNMVGSTTSSANQLKSPINLLSFSAYGPNLTANFFGVPAGFTLPPSLVSQLNTPVNSLALGSPLTGRVLVALAQVWSIMGELLAGSTVAPLPSPVADEEDLRSSVT